jgi:hypothetical protein
LLLGTKWSVINPFIKCGVMQVIQTSLTHLMKFIYSLRFDHNFAISSLRNVCHTKGNTSGVAQLHERVEASNDVRYKEAVEDFLEYSCMYGFVLWKSR